MDAKQVLAMIKEKDVKFVDFRFTDPRGKWQHTARMASATDEGTFVDGVMFDGSSIGGWKAINDSDMILMPDPSTAVLDPFAAQTTLVVTCDVVEPSTGQLYARCPRSTAKRAEAYMKSSGVGDTAVFGPELEFFVFDDVRYDVQMGGSFYSISSNESPWNSGAAIEGGNLAHRPGVKGGYFPVQPVDTHNDLRAEMMSVCADMGLVMEIHHHEVAPAQNELGFKFDTLVKTADNVQKYKYTLHNVAHSYGKTLTFMPKPLYGDNGSGMHTHQSIWKDNKPLFAGSGYADLSETALYYIGGIIKHAKALNAFCNASTNSYKRVIPGFEAPVLLADRLDGGVHRGGGLGRDLDAQRRRAGGGGLLRPAEAPEHALGAEGAHEAEAEEERDEGEGGVFVVVVGEGDPHELAEGGEAEENEAQAAPGI